jgi:hypothetical protein
MTPISERQMNPHLAFLLSSVYDATRLDHPEHLADLRKSGLTDETIRAQKITDVPPHIIRRTSSTSCSASRHRRS